ncbi:MAG TPA: hypothetical protein VLB46_01030 [Pyrinomonadaceae bacterium]|nr:hypothetical protein [Pyrinomonadaceae bacterium]
MARALGFLTCFVIFWTLTLTAKGQPVGYVLEIRGAWYLNGNPANSLRRWQSLPASSVIHIQSPGRSDTITVADMRGGILFRRDCPTDCQRPVRLPPPPAQPTLAHGILQAAVEWLWGSPDRYVAARSRGGEISDGIVKLVDGKIDLKPLLHVEGRYHQHWRSLTRNQKVETATWSEAVELSPNVSFPDLKSGLYEFELLRRVGTELEGVSSAWVLVVLPEDYETAMESHAQAVLLTKKWKGKVSTETVLAFLRAHLDDLAQGRMK